MFLSEMTRQISTESQDIDVDTTYSTSGAGSWETLHSYGSIEPATAGIYVIQFEVQYTSNPAWLRLKIGDRWVYGKALTSSWVTEEVVTYLPSGSQTVLAQGYGLSGTPDGVAQIKNFKMGRVDFADVDGESLQTYSTSLSVSLTSRFTPAGDTNQATLIVNCFAYTSGADTNFENAGDDETNGVSISVDESQVDWTNRQQDTDSKENAWADYWGVVDVGSSWSVEISKDNANTVVHISIILCPWILPADTDFEPVALDFPQGSTLYLMTEPLILNPTVYVRIGKLRAIDFGDATTYYSDDSSTGIQQINYTFEEVQENEASLYVYGRGACIASIGVDVR